MNCIRYFFLFWAVVIINDTGSAEGLIKTRGPDVKTDLNASSYFDGRRLTIYDKHFHNGLQCGSCSKMHKVIPSSRRMRPSNEAFPIPAKSGEAGSSSLPIISIETVDFYAQEGKDVAVVKLTRSGVTDSPLTVTFTYSGTSDNSDFTNLSTSMDFSSGQTQAVLVLNPKSDAILEDTESIIINVNPSTAYDIQNGVAHAYLRNKDYAEGGVVVPLDKTFNLHSFPGGKHTIYLNFLGGNYYHNHDGLNPAYVSPFDMNNDSELSDDELITIQHIWKSVSEDFKPFKVNVTTELPSEDDLKKTSNEDDRWGVSILIGDDPGYGFAWSGSEFWTEYNYPGYASINKSDGTFWDIGTIAQTCSHEVGHTFGLNHHGGPGAYYDGHDAGGYRWVAIMGTAWTALNHWSNGDYPGASNPGQDDLTIISNSQNGFGYRIDDHADESSQATALVKLDDGYDSLFMEGIIEQNTDIDWFTFNHEGGDLFLSILPENDHPNLDIGSKLYDSDLNLISSSDRVADLSAGYSLNLEQGTYYLSVQGVGSNEGFGYSDYGSLGEYTIVSGSGTIAEYLPNGESGSSPISGSSDFSTLTISNLTAQNLGSSYYDGAWALYSSSSSGQYFSFTVEAGAGNQVVYDKLQVSFYSFSSASLSLRSSLDDFSSLVGSQTLEGGKHNILNFNLGSLVSSNKTVEFRMFLTENSGYHYLTGPEYGYAKGIGLSVTGRVLASTSIEPLGDLDNDGLTNEDEGALLESPTDTDGDGNPDYLESNINDSDNDGTTDHLDATVDDLDPPSITVPNDIIVAANDQQGTPASEASISQFLSTARANDNIDLDVSITHDAPSNFPLGITQVIFIATDDAGNTETDTASVTVTDQTPPSISIIGMPNIFLNLNSAYEDQGATALDNVDGSEINITTTSNINTEVEGSYTVTYTAEDSANNISKEVRNVIVSGSSNSTKNSSVIVEYLPNGELGSEPITGLSKYSSLTISDLSAINFGSSYYSGVWTLYSSNTSPQYLSFDVQVGSDMQLVYDQLQVSFYSFSSATLSLRSNKDNFGTDIDSQLLGSNKHNIVTFDLGSITSSDESIEFRIYVTKNSGYHYLTGPNFGYAEGKGLIVTGKVLIPDSDDQNSSENTVDTDSDGLYDRDEKEIHGTDPNDPDSDGDGFLDGKEVNYGANPLISDKAVFDMINAEPSKYGLYTSEDLNMSIANAKSDGETSVTSNPSAYNLVTQDAYDQMMNDLMSASDSNATHYTEGWFYHPSRGWMWTDRSAYPYFYDATDKDWMYFQSGYDKPKFYRYKTKTWLTVE